VKERVKPHPPIPSPLAGRGQGGGVPWHTSPELWEKLKPLARQMRREPTPAENRLWRHLRGRQVLGFKFRRQHAIDRFIVDFYCAEVHLIVEVDGPIHLYSREEDEICQECLESLGMQVLRFTNEQVADSLDVVLEQIAAALKKGRPAQEDRAMSPLHADGEGQG
jgi:very-short-patch-repair endonuclease